MKYIALVMRDGKPTGATESLPRLSKDDNFVDWCRHQLIADPDNYIVIVNDLKQTNFTLTEKGRRELETPEGQ